MRWNAIRRGTVAFVLALAAAPAPATLPKSEGQKNMPPVQ